MIEAQKTTSRFAVLDTPIAVPGCCHICGSVGDGKRKFVDFGLNVEFVGVIYFCTLCLAECLAIIGFIRPEEYKAVLEAHASTSEELEESQDECTRLRAVVDAAGILGDFRSSSPIHNAIDDKQDDEPHADDVESERGDVKGSAKSSDGGGRKVLSDNASNDKIDF